ncbi:hypothetical protein IMG5_127430 [Ichthyophthirius multifiliis]|uniref:Ribosome assembly factor mrt4 n=1 Tax=Ichthyophthirius multifiliis TaxID=5932 RepID=G0QVX4_ICHMU|nr:hypothetical protein IMG5_127430 [Ichthyophthirius multifiliis]EGR30639.1 hypothetical protein IMG5_127430 [Ichthyophthirius multifiliis]|eukprot:XP_004032226.1 hypothetical protein IMG5_127430 [Ichthyophthirius multifiliis]
MPKSKRNKVISLTKTKKNPIGHKQKISSKLNECIEKYDNIFLFSHQNMTTIPFRQIQQEWNDSKFFLGKNKVMQVILGRDQQNEQKENLHKLSQQIKGDCGLLFTSKSLNEVQQQKLYNTQILIQISRYFNEYECLEYAKAGTIADETIILQKDSDVFKTFSHSMDNYLRQLGIDVMLNKGELQIQTDFILCQKGKAINTEQAKILVKNQNIYKTIIYLLKQNQKLLKQKKAQFKIILKCYYHKPKLAFIQLE